MIDDVLIDDFLSRPAQKIIADVNMGLEISPFVYQIL